MTDVMTAEQRSRVMSRNKGKDTTPERYIHRLTEVAGLTFTRHDSTLPGKPDLVFHDEKVAVFVDGDYWHGWRFPIWKHRLSEFWREKISRTRTRDERNFRRLRRMGWSVLRVWEHQVEKDVVECVARIAEKVGQTIDRQAVEAAYAIMPQLKRRNRLPKP